MDRGWREGKGNKQRRKGQGTSAKGEVERSKRQRHEPREKGHDEMDRRQGKREKSSLGNYLTKEDICMVQHGE